LLAKKGNVGMKVNLLKKSFKKTVVLSAISGFIALASLVHTPAFSREEAAKVFGTLDQNKIVLVDGKEIIQPADKVAPGDLLQYRVRYSNTGATAANNLVVTLPIPKGLEFAAATDSPRAALASLDGEKFEVMPIKRLVRQADGRETLQEVPATSYRALRWQVDQLQAGKVVNFTARARVENSNQPIARRASASQVPPLASK
jgi:uncharacterized repeat protein (TIGR01451 family)